jgi:hypothetical protein
MAPNAAALAFFASFNTEVSVSPFVAVEIAFEADSGDALFVSMALIKLDGVGGTVSTVASWGPAAVIGRRGTGRSSKNSVIDCEIIAGWTNSYSSSSRMELIGAAMRKFRQLIGFRCDSPVS